MASGSWETIKISSHDWVLKSFWHISKLKAFLPFIVPSSSFMKSFRNKLVITAGLTWAVSHETVHVQAGRNWHKNLPLCEFLFIFSSFLHPLWAYLQLKYFWAHPHWWPGRWKLLCRGAVIGVITGKITNQIFYFFTEEKAPWQMSNSDSRYNFWVQPWNSHAQVFACNGGL